MRVAAMHGLFLAKRSPGARNLARNNMACVENLLRNNTMGRCWTGHRKCW